MNTLAELKEQLIKPYSAPDAKRIAQHNELNAAVEALANAIASVCPNTESARHAMFAVVNARMWTNHAIATGDTKTQEEV